MAYLSSLLVFIFFSSGMFMMMRRNSFDILIGATLMSQGTFILLISMGGWSTKTQPPLLDKSDFFATPASYSIQGEEMNDPLELREYMEEKDKNNPKVETPKDHESIIKSAQHKAQGHVDPLPQALILTAIVINFGITAFLIILVARGIQETETLDIGELPKEEAEL